MNFTIQPRRRALVAGALAASLFAAPLSAFAEDSSKPQPGLISVSAEGVVAVAPDMALVSLTVMREADTARAALDANNEAMEAVLKAMKDEGIAERDLQTGGFSIQPRWVYPQNPNGTAEQPKITGYTVANTLSVRIRDISRLGAILDNSVSLGVNQGGEVIFTNSDLENIRDFARLQAIAEAKSKAQAMVEALGASLGRISQISENAYAAPPMPMMRAEMAMAAPKADSSVPMAAGENEYRVTVSISWEIAQ